MDLEMERQCEAGYGDNSVLGDINLREVVINGTHERLYLKARSAFSAPVSRTERSDQASQHHPYGRQDHGECCCQSKCLSDEPEDITNSIQSGFGAVWVEPALGWRPLGPDDVGAR